MNESLGGRVIIGQAVREMNRKLRQMQQHPPGSMRRRIGWAWHFTVSGWRYDGRRQSEKTVTE